MKLRTFSAAIFISASLLVSSGCSSESSKLGSIVEAQLNEPFYIFIGTVKSVNLGGGKRPYYLWEDANIKYQKRQARINQAGEEFGIVRIEKTSSSMAGVLDLDPKWKISPSSAQGGVKYKNTDAKAYPIMRQPVANFSITKIVEVKGRRGEGLVVHFQYERTPSEFANAVSGLMKNPRRTYEQKGIALFVHDKLNDEVKFRTMDVTSRNGNFQTKEVKYEAHFQLGVRL